MGHFGGKSHCGRWRPSIGREFPWHEPEDRATMQPAHGEIARLAYSYWEARGGGGSAMDDWLRAEAELRNRR